MRLDLQAKLLRVLQEQEFERVGGTHADQGRRPHHRHDQPRPRVVCGAGHFRRDLFFRLSVIPISIPPLRERPDDIPLLSARFAMRAAAEMAKEIKAIAPGNDGDAPGLRVARQRARAPACDRARGDPFARHGA